MARSVAKSSENSMVNLVTDLAERQQKEDVGSSSEVPKKKTKLSMTEKISLRKLRNRESAQLSRNKKKMEFDMLCEMVHTLTNNDLHLRKEIEILQFNQEKLLAENKELREQLAIGKSSIPKPVIMKSNTSDTIATNSSILIDGPAVSTRHPLQKGKRNRSSCLTLCYQIRFLLLTTSLILSYQKTIAMQKTWMARNILTIAYQTIWKNLPMNYLVKAYSMKVVLMKWWGAHQKSWNPVKILVYPILIGKIIIHS